MTVSVDTTGLYHRRVENWDSLGNPSWRSRNFSQIPNVFSGGIRGKRPQAIPRRYFLKALTLQVFEQNCRSLLELPSLGAFDSAETLCSCKRWSRSACHCEQHLQGISGRSSERCSA